MRYALLSRVKKAHDRVGAELFALISKKLSYLLDRPESSQCQDDILFCITATEHRTPSTMTAPYA
jgi:hypothetical protein